MRKETILIHQILKMIDIFLGTYEGFLIRLNGKAEDLKTQWQY